MANADVVKGAKPVYHPSGRIPTRVYNIPSSDGTATFVGDFVKSHGSADSNGVPTVIQAAATDTIRGVIVHFIPNPDALGTNYRLASTARYCVVADDPQTVFEIQEDADGGALAATDVGLNADIVVGSGNTTTGLSGMELDTSDKKSATAQLRILGFVQRPDNVIGANAKVLVKINEHELSSTTGA